MSDLDTRERIIHQSSELFRRYGVRSVSMDDLANQLAMSKKTLYQYFKDKKEIVLVCTEYMMQCELHDMEAMSANVRDVIDELLRISLYMRKMLRMMNPSLLFDLKKYHTDAWEVYLRQKQEFFFKTLQDALARGIEQGHFRPDINIPIIARMRMEQVEMGFNPQIFPQEQFTLETVQMQLFEFFVYGIVTDSGRELFKRYSEEYAHLDSSSTFPPNNSQNK